MAANTSMFNIGDIVTVRIPQRYGDSKWLYKRRGLSELEQYNVSDVSFCRYSIIDDLIDWRYELNDGKFSFIPEDWLSIYEEDEDICTSDIEYLITV